jgi:hypothetical protein
VPQAPTFGVHLSPPDHGGFMKLVTRALALDDLVNLENLWGAGKLDAEFGQHRQ